MSVVPEIRSYSQSLCSLDDLVSMHILISSGTRVSDCLIYRDPNFRFFLENVVLNAKDEDVYLLMAGSTAGGFCRLRFVGDALHLNNIYIKEEFRGQGAGKLFLSGSILLSLKKRYVPQFSLDVFMSNTTAFNWYQKIGLKVINRLYWYGLVPETDFGPALKDVVSYGTDKNGFTTVSARDERIGSILNGRLVLIDFEAIQYFGSESLAGARLRSREEDSYRYGCNTDSLDVSVTMKGELAHVLTMLSR